MSSTYDDKQFIKWKFRRKDRGQFGADSPIICSKQRGIIPWAAYLEVSFANININIVQYKNC